MIKQCTLRNPITATGTGLHTGENIKLRMLPAPANSGIRLRRTDLSPPVEIQAALQYVTDTSLSTTLGIGDISVSTVEHLMSALCALGIDNAWLEVSGGEIPILDGSAGEFTFLIRSAGVVEQEADRNFIRILKPIRVDATGQDAYAMLEPYEGLKLSFTLVYDHPVLKKYANEVSVDLTSSCYIRELSRARTFGFAKDFETMWAQNKALGASMDNAVAVGEDRILNENGLRYDNEFSRHKILDALGDLYLLGKPLLAHFTGYKSGHKINSMLLQKLLQLPDHWELVTRKETQIEANSPAFRPPSPAAQP